MVHYVDAVSDPLCALMLVPGACMKLWLIAANVLAWALIIAMLYEFLH
jgi:hypothetical protein